MIKNISSSAFPIFIITVLCTALSYISVRFAISSKLVLDAATQPSMYSELPAGLTQLAILVVLQLVLQILCTVINLKAEISLKNRLRSKLFDSLLHKQYSSLTAYHSGELINRLNGDIDTVSSTAISIIPDMLALLVRLVLGFWALYSLDRDFALIFLVVGPFVLIATRLYSKRIKPLHKQFRQSQGRIQSFMLEALRSITVVKTFGVYNTFVSSADELQKENMSIVMKRGFLSIVANILFYISLNVGYYFAIGWCAYKISIGIMSIGTFAAIIQLVGQVQTPFRELASVYPQFFTLTASVERINELESLPDDVGKYGNIDINEFYSEMKSIFADRLSFSYENENVLDNASFEIPKGRITSISGISGIGKTTLFKLLLGILLPQKGSIGIECADGKRYYSDASLRKLFAYVPQGNMLISGTVSENICFMDPKPDPERMVKAAETACVTDFIEDLADGYDTLLGENGLGLSEGQLQRLAVARALYSGSPVILLDEATSALDEQTERRMLENIKALPDITCVIISHKECALRISDCIITINNGHIDLQKSF